MAHKMQSLTRGLLCLHGLHDHGQTYLKLSPHPYRPLWSARAGERTEYLQKVLNSETQNLKRPIESIMKKTSQQGLKNGWTRATFILRNDYLEKVKSLAYWKRKKVKEVMDEVLGSYLEGKRIKPKRDK